MASRLVSASIMAAVVALLAACGGGGSSGGSTTTPTTPPAAAPVAKADAYRFLNQASFGATEAEATRLMGMGDSTNAYSRWIDDQLTQPVSLELPVVNAAYSALPQPITNIGQLHNDRIDAWFRNAVNAPDQLRQRVAFALSEIMVVSQIGGLQGLPFATTDYYDTLARDALGDFRVLMQDVTLHPAMGVYLTSIGNQKANTALNIRPDENYAREAIQLFTVGLVQLNADGSSQVDSGGVPLPTYDQTVVEGFARVYTGWNWACPMANPNCTFTNTKAAIDNQVKPMQQYGSYHETGTKLLLNYPNAALTTIPAGQTADVDLKNALDNIYNHPNVAPFASRQLIQKLVTSNPSPGYIARIAAVFNNDGAGKRGNLAAVVRAILLDSEARTAPSGGAIATAGKVKEPLLRLTQFWRAYGGHAASGKFVFTGVSGTLGQGPQQSASVFNFFSPFYAPPGEIADQNLVAPELQIATEYQNTVVTNYFWDQALCRTQAPVTGCSAIAADTIVIDTSAEIALASNSDALVQRIADKLLAGQISDTLRAQAKAQVDKIAATSTNQRAAEALYFIVSSPEFTQQL